MKAFLKRQWAIFTLSMMLFNILIPLRVSAASKDEIIFPLKEISKLECRFEEFDNLSSSCKQKLPKLSPDDYKKYATKNGWYNDFTRIYTVLWGSSYKYGWDVGNGWHQGTDIATAKGTPVYSIADGTVIESGSDIAWGKYVSIKHNIRGKEIVSNYAHLSKIHAKKWDSIDVWDKIGEVGSTGNSTGNHLHFQIDLPSTFHPYYYDWNACPYSYYEITEKWVCFDELDKHTFDPLVFLEGNGAVLDEVRETSNNKNTNSSSNTSSSSASSSSQKSSNDIFDTTIYYGYGTSSDVKEIQRIYNKLGYYDGRISGDFEDIEDSLIDYQVATGVIPSRNADGAGWFGPKTRTQTQQDYNAYVASGGKAVIEVSTQNKTTAKEKQKIEKVSRENLMTREEREAQEMEEFLDIYSIDFKNSISQLSDKEVKVSTLRIENKKWRWFRGNTPGNVTFSYDTNILSVFPESFYNFTNGEREITITGKQPGHTNISIKIGEVIVKTLSVSVGKAWEKPEVNSAKLYLQNDSILWEENTGLILMKDQYNNALVKNEYQGTFSLEADENLQYCIKKWRLQDIKAIYKRNCFPEEYTNSLTYTYEDTIAGVLIFDYKILSNSDTSLSLTSGGNTLANKEVTVGIPKWLKKSHEYYDQIIEALSSGIVSDLNNGYFLEDRLLSQDDGLQWIINSANKTNNDIEWIYDELSKWGKNISRKEFLELTYKYLWNNAIATSSQDYRDMSSEEELLVASLLWNTYQWKDNFWENYFRPDKEITRWEALYMLLTALEAQWHGTLVRK